MSVLQKQQNGNVDARCGIDAGRIRRGGADRGQRAAESAAPQNSSGLNLLLVDGESFGTQSSWDFDPYLNLGALAFRASTTATLVAAGRNVAALRDGDVVGRASNFLAASAPASAALLGGGRFWSACAHRQHQRQRPIRLRADDHHRTEWISRRGGARLLRAGGSSPIDYLISWRMIVAQNALMNTVISLSAIADMTGYQSLSAFSLAFKRDHDCAPGAYRMRHRRPQAQRGGDASGRVMELVAAGAAEEAFD